MSNSRNAPRMPQAGGLQPPQPREHRENAPPIQTVHRDYADEAARAAQRYFDMTAEIATLHKQVQDWEQQTKAAESNVVRLERQVYELTERLDRRTEELTKERDEYRFRLHALCGHFETAGSIILQCLTAARGETTPQVDMKKLMHEIETDKKNPTPDMPEPKLEGPGIPEFLQQGPRKED
jgi:chromosome segregation ATPase